MVLAFDTSKLSAPGVAVGIAWDDIDVIVTDLDPDDERLTPFRHLAEIR